MTADLIALLDRERAEVERLKGVINRLHQHISKWSGDWHEVVEQRDSATRQVETLLLEVKRLSAVIELGALRALFGPRPAVEVYAAQNELELLRVIRKSQGEGITKLRQQLTEACKERDAASVRNEGLRKQLFDVQESNERLRFQLRDAREATNAGAIRYCDVCKERDELYREMDRIRKALDVSQAINRIIDRRARTDGPPVLVKPDCGCMIGVICRKCSENYVVYSNPVEAMKANPRLQMMLDDNRRNIDNQKAYEAPNCPSS